MRSQPERGFTLSIRGNKLFCYCWNHIQRHTSRLHWSQLFATIFFPDLCFNGAQYLKQFISTTIGKKYVTSFGCWTPRSITCYPSPIFSIYPSQHLTLIDWILSLWDSLTIENGRLDDRENSASLVLVWTQFRLHFFFPKAPCLNGNLIRYIGPSIFSIAQN